MAKQFINPDGLYKPGGYTHVVSSTGGKVVFISGQITFDAAGNLVGAGNLRAQTEQVFKNLQIAVASVGGELRDIVKINIYIVDYDPSTSRAPIIEVRNAYFGDHAPASTLIGIPTLALDGLLIEIEAIAVID